MGALLDITLEKRAWQNIPDLGAAGGEIFVPMLCRKAFSRRMTIPALRVKHCDREDRDVKA